MNWVLKMAAFRALSWLPGGVRVYRLAQERCTGSLVPTRERVQLKVDVGLRYFDWLKAHGHSLAGATHLDFGTGWHPTIPFLYRAFGCGEQFLFDLSPLLDAGLIAGTARVVREITSARRSRRAR